MKLLGSAILTALLATGASAVTLAADAAVPKAEVVELDWEDLVPVSERGKLSAGPPPPIHDYLGEGGPAAMQSTAFEVVKDLEGATVRLPGFIVPLDVGRDGMVNEFFLVPYFGACIHVPPPPPNQIVHVKMQKGVALDSIFEAYWVTGKMQLQKKTTRFGASAYALHADKVEVYKY